MDLCTRELVEGSAFRERTHVAGPSVSEPFSGYQFHGFDAEDWVQNGRRAAAVCRLSRVIKPDVVVVQENLKTASQVALRQQHIPVILQTHNFHKCIPVTGVFARLRHELRRRRYHSTAAITFVSEACLADFQRNWRIDTPVSVLPNGMSFDDWRAKDERSCTVLMVGRSAPEKGLLQGAQAISMSLRVHPKWRAHIILSEVHVYPEYTKKIYNALSGLEGRVKICVQQPYNVVKEAYEDAAIALVPSVWEEPFGRTALEAHAGGAALISSGRGGLREVSGDGAIYVSNVTAAAWSAAISKAMSGETCITRLAQRGTAYARSRYSLSVVAGDMDRLLQRVADSRAGDRS